MAHTRRHPTLTCEEFGCNEPDHMDNHLDTPCDRFVPTLNVDYGPDYCGACGWHKEEHAPEGVASCDQCGRHVPHTHSFDEYGFPEQEEE